MSSDIQKYVNNQEQYPEGSKANVVGSDQNVEKIGKAWYGVSEEIQMALIHLKDEYSTNEVFDSKEYAAFKKGLNALPKFMMECFEEYNAVNQQEATTEVMPEIEA